MSNLGFGERVCVCEREREKARRKDYNMTKYKR